MSTTVKMCAFDGCTNRSKNGRWCSGHQQQRAKGRPMMPIRRALPVPDRFWPKVNKDGPTMPHMDSPCWVWTGRVQSFGYGEFDVGAQGKHHRHAHRVSYSLANGPIPEGLFVLHACDNPPCVNPAHLHVGNQTDNMREARDRGRLRPSLVRLHGEAHPDAKLTEAQVREMRSQMAAGMSDADAARTYGVTSGTVWKIRAGRSWRHLLDPSAAPSGVVVPTWGRE